MSAFDELEEFGALPTEEIAFDWDAEEPTNPAWRIPEGEWQHRRPTVPSIVCVKDEDKEG